MIIQTHNPLRFQGIMYAVCLGLIKLQAVLCGGSVGCICEPSINLLVPEIQNLCTMAVEKQGTALDAVNSQSTRTLLRTIILFLIAGAAIASRLFSVIRKSLMQSLEAETQKTRRARASFP